MKIFILLCIFVSTWSCVGQEPPLNDTFANRITLVGDDVTFSGNTAGASFQCCGSIPVIPSADVWWSWTATQDCEVAIVPSQGSLNSGCLAFGVFVGTNNQPGGLELMTWNYVDGGPRFLFFRAAAGQEYQIQLGRTSDDCTQETAMFHLFTANLPIITVPPQSQTVSPGGAAFFSVIAGGGTPLQFQWQCNGVDLSGETAQMLTVLNVTTNQTGDYTVVIRNPYGTNTSPPAQLMVSTSDVAPTLSFWRESNTFRINCQVAGEIGRSYLLESSTNLVSWQPEAAPSIVYGGEEIQKAGPRRVVTATDGVGIISLPIEYQSRFYRVSRYAATNEVCQAQLKAIRFAKILWANDPEQPWPGNSTVSFSLLAPYYKSNVIPLCPLGGTYFIGGGRFPLIQRPTCNFGGATTLHALEEP